MKTRWKRNARESTRGGNNWQRGRVQWASVLDLAWAEERGGEGRGREEREDRKTRGNAGEADAELQPCPWLVVLTRQVFFPFLFFLPVSLAPGPYGARPQVPGWHLRACAAQSAPPGPGPGRRPGHLVVGRSCLPLVQQDKAPAYD